MNVPPYKRFLGRVSEIYTASSKQHWVMSDYDNAVLVCLREYKKWEPEQLTKYMQFDTLEDGEEPLPAELMPEDA
jgi:hypothetical protein